jgi:hypothetical protein
METAPLSVLDSPGGAVVLVDLDDPRAVVDVDRAGVVVETPEEEVRVPADGTKKTTDGLAIVAGPVDVDAVGVEVVGGCPDGVSFDADGDELYANRRVVVDGAVVVTRGSPPKPC